MTLPDLSLQEQRHLLQQQLRVQRQRILSQLGDDTDAPDHFPRSMTMRFLSGRTGLVFLSQLALWRLGSHYPGAVSAAQQVIRMFSHVKSLLPVSR